MWKVEPYTRPNGRCAIKDWINAQNTTTKASIFARLAKIQKENFQNLLDIKTLVIIRGKGKKKPSIPGFYELRSLTYKWRIALYYDKSKGTVLLLHGWGKESKGQDAEIDKARTLLYEYLDRRN